jgi:hypothetical protein
MPKTISSAPVYLLIPAFACAIVLATGSPAAAKPLATYPQAGRIALVRPTCVVHIDAAPAKVWKKLVSLEGLAAMGYLIDNGSGGDKNGKGPRTLDKVGDHARAMVQRDAGNLVVTYASEAGEWRASWDPEQGRYICSIRFALKEDGKGTELAFADWYSEEKADMADADARESEKAMAEGLARFKALAEK